MISRTLRYKSIVLTGASLACLSPVWAQETETPADEEARVLGPVVVRGEFIPDEKRDTSEVASLVDAEDFQLAGDADAAAALARVVGVSTAENKFVYVRGLNERYSSATLNGSPLPSPAPLRRVAPLDLFPTSALEGILVQKTFSPNLPGEFGGGLVDIRTKAIPDERFLTIGVGIGGDTETSFQDGLLYDGSDTDWLGFDDGARDLPPLADQLNPDPAFGAALTDNSSLLVLQEGQVGPDFDISLSAGDAFDLSDNVRMGVLGSVSYGNSWTTREGQRGQGRTSAGVFSQQFVQDRRSTQNDISLNGLVTVGFDLFDDHEIKFTGFVSRSTEKEARTVEGVNVEGNDIRTDTLEFIERQLWTTQVQGTHYFEFLDGTALSFLQDLELEWRASYSEAKRDAPYRYDAQYDEVNGQRFLLGNSRANRFVFSTIDDDSTDFGVDFTYPFQFDGDFFSEIDVKFGYSYVENDRDSTNLFYDIEGTSAARAIALGTTDGFRNDFIYQYIFANNLGAVTAAGGAQFPRRYLATLENDAAYFQFDAQVTPFIRASIGGRFESALVAIDTLDLGPIPSTNFVEGCIERQADLGCEAKDDFLPAATITWNPVDDIQVRFGYSETLTRPQFRELAPAVFTNTETDVDFVGNPFLENASIKNYDARAEYYFARDQFLTFGVFYKDMERPIEEVLQPTENITTTFVNVPAAELYGFEIEYQQELPVGEWLDMAFFSGKDWTIKTNYTYTDSEVQAGRDPSSLGLSGSEFCAQFPDECVIINTGTPIAPVSGLAPAAGRIEDGRRLQGQSEHLFNFQFGYFDADIGSEATILVNYASERIRTGEQLSLNLPAIIEQPPITVDFVYNAPFELYGGEYEFSFKVENLFGDDYEATQSASGGSAIVDTYGIGQSISFGLSRSF